MSRVGLTAFALAFLGHSVCPSSGKRGDVDGAVGGQAALFFRDIWAEAEGSTLLGGAILVFSQSKHHQVSR